MSSGVIGCHLMSSVVICCHMLSCVVIWVICSHLLSYVFICCHLLASVVICCHLMSYVVTCCHLMSLLQDLTILKLFGNLDTQSPWGVVEGSSPLKTWKYKHNYMKKGIVKVVYIKITVYMYLFSRMTSNHICQKQIKYYIII